MPIPDFSQAASGPDHLHVSHAGHAADVQFSQEFWEQRYRSNPSVWSGNANTHLIREAADLTPGTALDVGAGEGADALWLAERGWQVTATDISTVALDRGASHAREAGTELVVLSRASVFVLPSLEEGFATPIIQAFHFGTPVIHSDAPALVEAGGDAGFVVEREDAAGYPERLLGALNRVLGDSELAKRLSIFGSDRARAFSWRDSAERVWQLHADL